MMAHEARLLALEAYNRLDAKGQECQLKTYGLPEGFVDNASQAALRLQAPLARSTTDHSALQTPAREPQCFPAQHASSPRPSLHRRVPFVLRGSCSSSTTVARDKGNPVPDIAGPSTLCDPRS
ncbi:unnamed protein product [Lampetra planeri]